MRFLGQTVRNYSPNGTDAHTLSNALPCHVTFVDGKNEIFKQTSKNGNGVEWVK